MPDDVKEMGSVCIVFLKPGSIRQVFCVSLPYRSCLKLLWRQKKSWEKIIILRNKKCKAMGFVMRWCSSWTQSIFSTSVLRGCTIWAQCFERCITLPYARKQLACTCIARKQGYTMLGDSWNWDLGTAWTYTNKVPVLDESDDTNLVVFAKWASYF